MDIKITNSLGGIIKKDAVGEYIQEWKNDWKCFVFSVY
jgi:hypothetical protein